jgi:hypothetical protein
LKVCRTRTGRDKPHPGGARGQKKKKKATTISNGMSSPVRARPPVEHNIAGYHASPGAPPPMPCSSRYEDEMASPSPRQDKAEAEAEAEAGHGTPPPKARAPHACASAERFAHSPFNLLGSTEYRAMYRCALGWMRHWCRLLSRCFVRAADDAQRTGWPT